MGCVCMGGGGGEDTHLSFTTTSQMQPTSESRNRPRTRAPTLLGMPPKERKVLAADSQLRCKPMRFAVISTTWSISITTLNIERQERA